MGAKPQYTDKQIKSFKIKIIDELSKGKSLKKILEEDDKLPSRRYVYEWLNPENDRFDQEFSNNYTRAREDSADLDAEKMEQLVDDIRNGKIDSREAKVIMDIYKWTAGKKKPKKYGDKIDVTSDGSKIESSQPTIINFEKK
jgi:hypothetical protein